MKREGFTLIELIVTVIIIGILAAIATPFYTGMQTKAQMTELYATVGTLRTAENTFYIEHGFYAAGEAGSCPTQYQDTGYDAVAGIQTILGVTLPDTSTSLFVYGIYYTPASIYVRVRAHFGDWGILCLYTIEGPDKGTWMVNTNNPWWKYLNVSPATQMAM